jgi:hypothetical protein
LVVLSVNASPEIDGKEIHMKMKIRALMGSAVVASVAFMGTMGSAIAADEWFVLGEQTIKSTDPSASIKSVGGRWDKDVKQVKLSSDADVQITNLVLHWDNRKDDTLKDVGTLKAGGQTAPKDAPGRKGRLTGVTVNYKILGDKPTANLKVWGLD